ncbi:MAG: hypothetical protein JJD98_17710 [Polaromonas sp.]|nr:hypothetical protein [Polaromonas sp.]
MTTQNLAGHRGHGQPGRHGRQHQKRLLGSWPSGNVGASYSSNAMSNWMSPYLANPLDLSLLCKLLQAEIDFTALTRLQAPKVFVSATHVTTGRPISSPASA